MSIKSELAKKTREMIVLAVAAGQFYKLSNAIANTTKVVDGLRNNRLEIRRGRKKGGVKEWWNR